MTDVARDVFLPVAAQPSVDALVEQAQQAESLGYDRAWLPESWGRNAMMVLTSIAERTSDIGLGTSITPIYSRSPALIGMSAATVQEVSDGRFRLGLGPSGPIVIENWHGVEYGNPLRRTRETIDVVRQVLAGEEVSYDGEYVDLSGFRLRSAVPDPAPSIDVAGMGPKSVELAGRFADGWHALMLTEEGLADRLADLERGAALGDRDPDDVRVTLSLTCAALEDRERARDIVRQHSAFYVGGMGTFYRDNLARQGYQEVANTVYDEWNDGDREEALAAIDDDLLDELAVAGTPEEARERLDGFAAMDGVDAVSVSFPRAATVEEIDTTIEALAPE
ncbi:TIGR04024 family LLM class F420-dependent oxidoreductase [Halomarina oriensis]|uniref:TIGR04024 family LLM class F420-dependent oxidoreductase n=1 Tax=Halomarina oriensis TaxID=671145 RepID=A0A6B0GFH6_9EURY|nr:TIGR04024 family LLM class F420-dependent oxidoreductase [Halomarina oriensis]MWG33572.1 TIGR04024 family LLM class F420-dependent oxidoreductase [Halomarina oriensis]